MIFDSISSLTATPYSLLIRDSHGVSQGFQAQGAKNRHAKERTIFTNGASLNSELSSANLRSFLSNLLETAVATLLGQIYFPQLRSEVGLVLVAVFVVPAILS
jgi:hypothetical protein